ncbi:MAG: hypothetical protein IJS84_04420 [Spirochaetales bacterium]|nr:hypothetical protein [Spirochaetales bacterium]
MRNELTILNALKSVIQEQLNGHLEEGFDSIGERNVAVDFPDLDLMPMKTMLYIQPNWANYESLSTESDASTFNMAVFIVCRKDKQENLTRKVYGYFNAMYSLLRSNWSMDGEVDFIEITDADFYPAVEGNRNIQAIEVSVSVRYTKDF